ncbi:MFS transporter, DHA1 family, inner membrane transport protein [Paraburkholderia fungorum]|uniref:MFS transporter, DHA1 family, inner membrane transport protein n=1 Tax=Paraburkholderia fungorum TaxID=134537 RepID=A0A1H1K0Q9_9BURK|nr:MFS transporter, DHA1 family, inner membrane transport protein [Paraburkholderia fungorum]
MSGVGTDSASDADTQIRASKVTEAGQSDLTLPTPAAAPPHGLGLSEFALALGGFAIGTAEFAAMGLLPDVASDLHVSVPQAGHMISAYALGVVVGAPLITVVFARVPRRALLIVLMLLYAIGNGATSLSHNYTLTILSRFIAGLPHGAYFGLAALAAASLVPPNKRGVAIAKVMLGLSVANVIGVPAATWLGQLLGWQSCFAAVAVIAAITAGLIAYALPALPKPAHASPLSELGALRRPQVLLTLLASAVGFGGVFSAYTYAASTLTHVTGLAPHEVPWVLAVIGVGMVLGNIVCGWLADRWLKQTMIGMYAFSALILIGYVFAAPYLWAIVPMLFGVGIGSALTPAFQSRLMDVAQDAQALAAALNHSAFNVANAAGAWLGGLVIAAGWGWQSTGGVGALLAISGIGVLAVSFVLEKRKTANA